VMKEWVPSPFSVTEANGSQVEFVPWRSQKETALSLPLLGRMTRSPHGAPCSSCSPYPRVRKWGRIALTPIPDQRSEPNFACETSKIQLFERIGAKLGKVIRGNVAELAALPSDIIIPIVGCSPELTETIARWRRTGRPWIYWDWGYYFGVFATWLRMGDNAGMYRWHVISFQLQGVSENVPADRYEACKPPVREMATQRPAHRHSGTDPYLFEVSRHTRLDKRTHRWTGARCGSTTRHQGQEVQTITSLGSGRRARLGSPRLYCCG
jgi:hypothetical protein